MSARFIVGDTRDVLASLPEKSVDLIFTSPPFLALRSYLPADHPDKHREIGSEATPADFLDTLLDIVELCDRVLAPHGSLVFELGDTYSGSGGAGGDYNEGGLRDGQNAFDGSSRRSRSGWHRLGARAEQDDQPPNYRKDGYSADSGSPNGGSGWPMAKSLCGIPTLFAWSLAYGRNLLRPEHTTEPWRIRNLIVWARPNPPVGALGDKFRPATSYLTVATKARDRYFDLDAVRTEHKADPGAYTGNGYSKGRPEGVSGNESMPGNPAGAPPLDYWVIPTQGYAGSHYATFPERLVERPVRAMCPEKVCRTCGEPSRRIAVTTNAVGRRPDVSPNSGRYGMDTDAAGVRYDLNGAPDYAERETLGWTDCGHDDFRSGIVLDAFAGSGTTLAVAQGHGRDSIGIDIDERNADLARERVGMFLTVEHFTKEEVA